MNLPPITKDIVHNYMIPANDRNASMDAMLISLYMQVSRFLCWHRVKVQGDKGNEFPMLYAFNFAASGAYKDEVLSSLAKVLTVPLNLQRTLKTDNYDYRKKAYDIEMSKLKADAKKDYALHNKPKRFKNTYAKGSIQGLQRQRQGAEEAGVGHVHYSNEEFADEYGIKDSNIGQLLSSAKEAYQVGNSSSNIIISEWRDDVEGVPLTFLLHSSAAALLKSQYLLNDFKKILETGIAKRSFILFDAVHTRVNRSDQEMEDDIATVEDNKGRISVYFQQLYEAIRAEEKHSNGLWYATKIIKVSPAVLKLKNQYRNTCNDTAKPAINEIVRIETYDRFWRAFRLATCIAVLEHPDDLTVGLEDYVFAMELTDKWGDQFKVLLEKDIVFDINELWDFIIKNPGVGKTEVRTKIKVKNTYQLNDMIEQIKTRADENGMVLIEKKGRGKAVYYSLVSIPENYQYIKDGIELNEPIDNLYERFSKEEVDLVKQIIL